ncbi:hypothetical protein [Bacterioplanoides sp.]|uniref:flagellar biosynthesis protein FlhF n=1 Tax=Bacterioplanoides sp. TaxID=2066072 RepID=UPI003B003361
MKVKRFVAANMQLALRKVSQELGTDAVIMSSKKVADGFEVVAALDYQSSAPNADKDVERQLELQRELEAARASRNGTSGSNTSGNNTQRSNSRSEQEQRLQYARSSDLSSPEGLKDVLQGLKQKRYDQGTGASANSGLDERLSSPYANSDYRPNRHTNDNLSDQDERPGYRYQREERKESLASVEQSSVKIDAMEERVAASEARYGRVIDAMSDELRELKNWMVSHQGSAWDTGRPLTWQQSQLWQRCQDVGLEPAWADRIASQIPDGQSIEDSWQQALKLIARDLPVAPPQLLEKGGRYALVGPTGAGKTTTIGKLAGQFVIHHGADSVALITLDNYRVAAHDQIGTFSRILGVELHKVSNEQELKQALLKTQHKKLVLVDSAGLASQDTHFQTQLSMLKKVRSGLQKLLVLPLTSQGRCLQENYEHFKAAGLTGCIFTKLDECFSLGPAMSVAALTQLPVTIVTDGPHIPDDVHYPDADKMVKLSEQMARMARTRWQAAGAMHMATQSRFQQGA